MRFIITCITFMILSLGYGEEANLPGWTEGISESTDVTALKMEGFEITQVINGEVADVTIINNTGQDISFSGRGEMPIFFDRNLRDGKWVDGAWDWCGTGREIKTVKNGEKIQVKVQKYKMPLQRFTIIVRSDNKKRYLIKLAEIN